MIPHSHSPCLTKDYMVIKLDSFEGHFSWNPNVNGVLTTSRQKEDNLWMVLDRKTNESFLSESNLSFVNNHFWNCYQSKEDIIVDSVASTHDYLFQYFRHNTDRMITDWENLFKPPQRCIIKTKEKKVHCSDLLNVKRYFDYPTYDPRLKTQGPPRYKEFYAISPQSTSSRWFDSIIKVDVASAQIVAEKNYPKYQFVSEADFIPTPNQETGVLITIVYDQMLDKSFVDFLDSA